MRIWPFSRQAQEETLEEKAATFDEIIAALDGGGSVSRTGQRITTSTALEVMVVFACVRIIAEGIAQIPMRMMRTNGEMRQPATNHSSYRLLYRRPNEWMTAFEFREFMTAHACLCGDALAIIVRNQRNDPIELLPLMPHQVKWTQLANRLIRYEVQNGKGEFEPISSENIFHLRGPMWETVTGMDTVKLARDAIGLAVATEDMQAEMHANGGRVAGVLSTDERMAPERIQAIRQHWRDTFGTGGNNRSGTAVLDGGWKYSQMALTAVDAQTIEARRFQIEEVCRAFRVFPQMAMQADKASTYASAEQFFLAHVTHTLQPWIERWEQTADRDLLDPRFTGANAGLYHHFNVNALLRGAAKDRAEFYSAMLTNGVMNPNEVRALEDMNPYEGGDEYRVPMNSEAPGANNETAPNG